MGATTNTWPPVGGQEAASLAWLSTIADFVASKDATLTQVAFRSTCNSLEGEVEANATVTGSGTAGLVRIPGSNFLKLRTASGTTANSLRSLRNRSKAIAAGASVFGVLTGNCRTAHYAVCVRTIVNATTATCNLAIANITDEATADAYLGVVGATSQTNFSFKIGAAAAVDTGVAIGTLGTTEHDLIWMCDGTNLSAYIDLNTTAAASGASNTAANASGHVDSKAQNGGTAANASHDILQWAVFIPA